MIIDFYSKKLFKLKDNISSDEYFANIGNLKCFKAGIIENFSNIESKEIKLLT